MDDTVHLKYKYENPNAEKKVGSLGSWDYTIPTPEPATMLLLGLGLIGVAGVRRKIQK